MSGLAICFHRDGQPFDPATIQAMLAAAPHRGPDGQWVRSWPFVGLGYAKTEVTLEEASEQQPLVSLRSNCAIVADVRLDNRADLLGQLPDRPPATTSDAELILRAYEAWGIDAAKRLLGDFAFAIWDPRRQRIVCARDPSGERSLFYRLDPRTFAAASEIQQLLQDPAVPIVPDEERIRDYLVPWRVYRNDHEQATTFYKNIFTLPAAHVLIVTASSFELERYWELTVPREIRYRETQQYVQHFADLFISSVQARLRSTHPVGAALSGGLDSTSIVSLAQVLYQRGLAENPGFVSFSMEFPGLACDETALIRDVQVKYGFDARFYAPIGTVSNLAVEPPGFLASPMKAPGELDPMLALAAESNIRTVLTGHLGDNCFGWSARFFDSLLRRGQVGEMLRHLRAYRATSGEASRKSLALYGLLPLLPLVAQREIQTWFRRREFEREREELVPGWIGDGLRPNLLDRHLSLVLAAERARRFPTEEREQTYATLYPPEVMPMASPSSIQILRPFGDRRLHEFLLAIPPEQMFEPHPYVPGFYPGAKLILRRAMRGILPESVRTQTGKPHFAAFVLEEIERRWVEYSSAFGPNGRSEVAARGYVEPRAFLQRLERMRSGEFGADGLYVVRVLNLETWLRTFNLPRARQTSRQSWIGPPSSDSNDSRITSQPKVASDFAEAGPAPTSCGATKVESSSGRR